MLCKMKTRTETSVMQSLTNRVFIFCYKIERVQSIDSANNYVTTMQSVSPGLADNQFDFNLYCDNDFRDLTNSQFNISCLRKVRFHQQFDQIQLEKLSLLKPTVHTANYRWRICQLTRVRELYGLADTSAD